VPCKICGSSTRAFGHSKTLVLNRYEVQYFRCERCGFVQTEEPYWLDEAYQSPIARSDIHYVHRNRSCGWVTRALIGLFYPGVGPYLDFGGGYGLFVRDMRDRGYDFHLLDRYSPNLFAKDFTWDRLGEGARAELITCFEVFEHVPDPNDCLAGLMAYSSEILFSTSLIPAGITQPSEWAYFAQQEGQHISIYTLDSLRALAERHGLYCHSNGRDLHLLSRSNRPLLRRLFPVISRPQAARLIQRGFRRPSLLLQDQAAWQQRNP
jgi:hypothetical protein